jgi:hypothetical protein
MSDAGLKNQLRADKPVCNSATSLRGQCATSVGRVAAESWTRPRAHRRGSDVQTLQQ